MQLVGDVHNPNLQSHFLRMARVLVFLGGVGAKREFRPGTFRTYSAHDMTEASFQGMPF